MSIASSLPLLSINNNVLYMNIDGYTLVQTVLNVLGLILIHYYQGHKRLCHIITFINSLLYAHVLRNNLIFLF
jgi:hypothetical protein